MSELAGPFLAGWCAELTRFETETSGADIAASSSPMSAQHLDRTLDGAAQHQIDRQGSTGQDRTAQDMT